MSTDSGLTVMLATTTTGMLGLLVVPRVREMGCVVTRVSPYSAFGTGLAADVSGSVARSF